MHLIFSSRGVELLDSICADDLALNLAAFVEASLCGRCRLAGKWQLDAAFGEHFVGDVKEVVDLGHAHIRHSLVDNLFYLNWSDADDERRAEHYPELAQRLAGDH